MKAIEISNPGGPEGMRVVETPEPEPGPGQALVLVDAAGVNFIDTYQRSGAYKMQMPLRLGLEGAGTVLRSGPGVEPALAAGARVAWSGVTGSYATHVLAPADKLIPLPADIDTRTAAAAMLQGLTVHYLVKSTFPLGPGRSCLVHAAAGGVGLLLCSWARHLGATVYGTTSTEDKAARARKAGAHEVILYTRADFEAELRRLTNGRGVSVVYDSVGKDTFDKSIRCLEPRGMMVLFGQSSGAVPPMDPQVLAARGSLFLTRPVLGHYTATREELLGRSRELFDAIRDKTIEITIGGEFPLEEAERAHRMLESRATSGKLILVPRKA